MGNYGGDTVWDIYFAAVKLFILKELTNIVWAYVSIGLHFCTRTRLYLVLWDFNSQTLANTVWAFTTDSHASPVLPDAITEAAKGRLKDIFSGLPRSAIHRQRL